MRDPDHDGDREGAVDKQAAIGSFMAIHPIKITTAIAI